MNRSAKLSASEPSGERGVRRPIVAQGPVPCDRAQCDNGAVHNSGSWHEPGFWTTQETNSLSGNVPNTAVEERKPYGNQCQGSGRHHHRGRR
jgi:hypothetical protein